MVLLSAVLQGNASSQYPSTRSLQGKRSEDRIVCKIGFVESFTTYIMFKEGVKFPCGQCEKYQVTIQKIQFRINLMKEILFSFDC